MFGLLNRRALLCSNLKTTITRTPSFLQHFSSSEQHSFTTNYLINNLAFSPETASSISTRVRLDNSEKPDSVLALFRTHGFTNHQLSQIIRTRPLFLSSDPNTAILPKFNFLLSKGASTSDLVEIITKDPWLMHYSLENAITPCYDFLKRYLVSDESTIEAIKSCTGLIYSKHPEKNIQTLLENGVPESQVPILLCRSGYLLKRHDPSDFKKAVEEVKEMGFDPNKKFFIVALNAKTMKVSLWERKIDLYKKWGWSEEIVVSVFKRYPWCMLASEKKIETVMEFWVNQMGWDSLVLAKHPVLLWISLEKIIIPRAFLLQSLQSRGLIKDAKSPAAFKVPEKMFLQKFVNCFEEESAQLLELYKEKKRSCMKRQNIVQDDTVANATA
ncbi:uncharacterized protein LOC130726920 [Lotus japonicus]|uniref:uncharacterized protein LOC130726920 n=1 Tax=Lotus japonicus TaxID=34305 RepID=UPI002590DDC8|nr:uncharacterized protein LOC130726920 [Lotus japonicus]